MCMDPVSITLAATAISAAGSVVSGIQKKNEGDANAAALETSAQQRLEKAKFDTEQADRQYRRNEGSVEAKIGTTGVDVMSFTSVLADDAKESALQKKAILVGAQVEANNLRFQAAGQKAAGRDAMIGGIFGAFGAVAGGSAKVSQINAINAKTDNLGGVSIGNDFTGFN